MMRRREAVWRRIKISRRRRRVERSIHFRSGPMVGVRPPVTVVLTWEGGLRFSAEAARAVVVIDGEAEAGPSPMQMLALALAGCMAVDVASILVKGRHPLQAIRSTLTGRRSDGQPARFTGFAIQYAITGNIPPEAVERAIELSREKYCSVWHSMREDIELETSYEIVPG
jgi:putative redox protein